MACVLDILQSIEEQLCVLQRSSVAPTEKNIFKSTTVYPGSVKEGCTNKENHMCTMDANKKHLASMTVSNVSWYDDLYRTTKST